MQLIEIHEFKSSSQSSSSSSHGIKNKPAKPLLLSITVTPSLLSFRWAQSKCYSKIPTSHFKRIIGDLAIIWQSNTSLTVWPPASVRSTKSLCIRQRPKDIEYHRHAVTCWPQFGRQSRSTKPAMHQGTRKHIFRRYTISEYEPMYPPYFMITMILWRRWRLCYSDGVLGFFRHESLPSRCHDSTCIHCIRIVDSHKSILTLRSLRANREVIEGQFDL